MKKITSIGILGIVLILAFGVYAHGGNELNDGIMTGETQNMMQNRGMMGMHEEKENVLDTGTFEDLKVIRETYNMPVLYWIDDAEEFEMMKEIYDANDQAPNQEFGGCHR